MPKKVYSHMIYITTRSSCSCLVDAIAGEYESVNEAAAKRSVVSIISEAIYLLRRPHTSCGCFETIGFYIPEVDGIGLADRDFSALFPTDCLSRPWQDRLAAASRLWDSWG